MRLIDENVLLEEVEKLPFINERYDHEHANKSFIDGIEIFHVMVLNVLKRQPIIDTESLQPQWIPFLWRKTTKEDGWDPEEFPLTACGEIPENGQDILVTNGCHVWSDTFFDDDDLYLDSGNDLVEDVTAWMPLPEPYKEEMNR